MKCITLFLFLFIPLFGFSQDVIYKNGWGHYIGTEKVTPKQFRQELAKNPVAFRQFKRAKILGYTSIGFSFASAALILTNTDNNLSRENVGLATVSYSAAVALAFIASIEGINAINTYNRNLSSSTRIAPTSNGIGLVYKF